MPVVGGVNRSPVAAFTFLFLRQSPSFSQKYCSKSRPRNGPIGRAVACRGVLRRRLSVDDVEVASNVAVDVVVRVGISLSDDVSRAASSTGKIVCWAVCQSKLNCHGCSQGCICDGASRING